MLNHKTLIMFLSLLVGVQIVPYNLLGQNVLARELQKLQLTYPVSNLPIFDQVIGNQSSTLTFTETEAEILFFKANIKSIKFIEREKPKILRIELPQPSGSNSLPILLYESKPFADGASIVSQNHESFHLETGSFYHGIIEGEDSSLVALSFHNGIIEGVISSTSGQYDIGRVMDGDYQVIYKGSSSNLIPEYHCYTDELPSDPINFNHQSLTTVNNNGCVLVYFEVSNSIYKYWGSVKAVTDYVGNFFNVVSTLYLNEDINIKISEIMVWTTKDPYPTSSSDDALASFKSNRTQFNGNLAHLLAYTSNNIGGIAYVDVLCQNKSKYGFANIDMSYKNFPNYSWTTKVVTHELGHNIGSKHTHWCGWPGGAIDNCKEPEGECNPGPPPTNGGTIMSYCHLKSYGVNFKNGFGPLPGNLIRQKVNQADCLSPCCVITDITGVKTDVKCFGEKSGSISLNDPPSGTPPFKYNWSNGATTKIINGLAEGKYTVTITDAKNCVGTYTFNINQPSIIEITLPKSSVCRGESETVDPQIKGGTPIYEISWKGPKDVTLQISPIILSIEGNYTVKVTDKNNCIVSKEFNITFKNKNYVSILDKDRKELPRSVEFCSHREMAKGNFQLNGSIGSSNQYTYYSCTWDWGNSNVKMNEEAITINFEDITSNFDLTLKAQDKVGCWSYDTLSFLFKKSPNELFDDVLCGVYSMHPNFSFTYPLLPGMIIDMNNGFYFITGTFQTKDSISDLYGKCRFEPISQFTSSTDNFALIQDTLIQDNCGPFLLAKDINNFCYEWYKIDKATGSFSLLKEQNHSWLKVSENDLVLYQYYAIGSDCNETLCDSVLISTRSNDGDIVIPCIDGNIQNLMIYPNPNSGQFYAKMEGFPTGTYVITIHDVMGGKLYSQKVQITRQKDVQHIILPNSESGIYFINLKGNNLNSTVKFMISH